MQGLRAALAGVPCLPMPAPSAYLSLAPLSGTQENVAWKEQWIATRLQKAERENATVYLQAGWACGWI